MEVLPMIKSRIFIFMVFFYMWHATSSANEVIAIATLLAEPKSYQLRTVTLHGTVTNLHRLEPYISGPGIPCHNSFEFTLQDETGSILVYIEGRCGTTTLVPPDVSDRQAVFVDAVVQVIDPSIFPSQIVGEKQGVRIIAKRIRR